MTQRIMVREEQLLAFHIDADGQVTMTHGVTKRIPWEHLHGCFLYAMDQDSLRRSVGIAVREGYQIVQGYTSTRRAMRGFTVGLGAWGHAGSIEVRDVDAWGLSRDLDLSVGEDVARAEGVLRSLCQLLNEEPTPFRTTANRWLSGLYDRLAAPLEPGLTQELDDAPGRPVALTEDVARFCRHAHVGGPILHVRTSLEPYVSLDRKRAFGNAMLEDLPSGPAVEVPLSGLGLQRWRPKDLMAALGVLDATVFVHDGPIVTLLPVLDDRRGPDFGRTLYPTGRFRGVWTTRELAYMEDSGRGRVEQIHRGVTFQGAPIFSGIIRYLRRIEPTVPVAVKRLEHILYGKCSRELQLQRMGSVTRARRCLPSDLLDDRSMNRIDGSVQLRSLDMDGGFGSGHPLYQIQASLTAASDPWTMNRPDRSAWITATNRVEVSRIIDRLDVALGAKRSGSYVGRVYVDGLDIEADVTKVPAMAGVEVRDHGKAMSIFRAGCLWAVSHDGKEHFKAAGTHVSGKLDRKEQLVDALQHEVSSDMYGPFASGRVWTRRGSELDPRLEPNNTSYPLRVDPDVLIALGFGIRHDEPEIEVDA